MLHIPDVIRRKAAVVGATTWIDSLSKSIDSLAHRWGFRVEFTFDDSTEALVLAVRMVDGSPATVKIGIPRPDGDQAGRELAAIRAMVWSPSPRTTSGSSCVRIRPNSWTGTHENGRSASPR